MWRVQPNRLMVILSIVIYILGDIRLAINTLEFAVSRSLFNSSLIPSFTNILFYNFIGKILYSKRAESELTSWNKSEQLLRPNLVQHWSRSLPPKDDIHNLLKSAGISGSRVSSFNIIRFQMAEFVFEHEPNFTNSLSTVSKIFTDLCDYDSTLRSVELQTNNRLDSYLLQVFFYAITTGIQIVARSTIFYNYNTKPASKTNSTIKSLAAKLF